MTNNKTNQLTEWMQSLRASLVSDYGITNYSDPTLQNIFLKRYYAGDTVFQALLKEFGKPRLK